MLNDRCCAVRPNIGDGDAMLLRCDEVDVIRARSRQADKAHFRCVCEQRFRDQDFVAQHDPGTGNALGDLVVIRVVVELKIRQQSAQLCDIKVRAHGRPVE